MSTIRSVMLVIVAAGLFLAGMHSACAQKKKTAPAKPSTTTEQKTPSASPAPAPPAPTPPPPVKMGNSLKDLLMKFRGEMTTLGVLKQVEADYFSVEEDGRLTIHPMNTIRLIRVLKAAESTDEEEEDEEPEPKLEIRLN